MRNPGATGSRQQRRCWGKWRDHGARSLIGPLLSAGHRYAQVSDFASGHEQDSFRGPRLGVIDTAADFRTGEVVTY